MLKVKMILILLSMLLVYFKGYSQSIHLTEIADKYFGPRSSPCKIDSVTIKELDSTIIDPELFFLVKDKTVIRISQDSVLLPFVNTESSDSLVGKLDIYYCEDNGGLLKIVYSIKEYKEIFLQRDSKFFDHNLDGFTLNYVYEFLDSNYNYNFQNTLRLFESDLHGELFELNGYLFLYSPRADRNMFWVNEETGPKSTWNIGIVKRGRASTGEENVPMVIRHTVDANTGELGVKMIIQMITSTRRNSIISPY